LSFTGKENEGSLNGSILQVKGLSLESDSTILADQIDISLARGKITGLVGESGSGKTLTALSILRLLPPGVKMISGTIIFRYPDNSECVLTDMHEKDLNRIRGNRISMIFQEPMTSLNPSMKCGLQVAETIRRHMDMDRRETRNRVLDLFREVTLPDPERQYNAWPHQLSGGQRQRVMIAMALATNPDLIIADEPTTALDVTVQKGILDLLASLRTRFNLSILLITHDLMILKHIADDIAVMYQGKLVESGPAGQILSSPKEQYTRGLIACKPSLESSPYRLPTISEFLKGKLPSRGELKKKVVTRNETPLLRIRNLNKWYYGNRGKPDIKAVSDVNFNVFRGETVGLVGESGCGKTTLGRTILRLVEANSGDIEFDGKNLRSYSGKSLREVRRKIQVVFQDPYSSLNPRIPAGNIIREPMDIHLRGFTSDQKRQMVTDLLEQVGLRESDAARYPHEFSGGQRQRIGIARALASGPEFIILDESVSALDVSVQAQILNLLNELKERHALTYIFISHDLTVVKYMSDRILVMKDGKIVETGNADQIYKKPGHPYTETLINSIPA